MRDNSKQVKVYFQLVTLNTTSYENYLLGRLDAHGNTFIQYGKFRWCKSCLRVFVGEQQTQICLFLILLFIVDFFFLHSALIQGAFIFPGIPGSCWNAAQWRRRGGGQEEPGRRTGGAGEELIIVTRSGSAQTRFDTWKLPPLSGKVAFVFQLLWRLWAGGCSGSGSARRGDTTGTQAGKVRDHPPSDTHPLSPPRWLALLLRFYQAFSGVTQECSASPVRPPGSAAEAVFIPTNWFLNPPLENSLNFNSQVRKKMQKSNHLRS